MFLRIIFYLWMYARKFGFDLFFARVNALLDEHAPYHKLSKKEISLEAKPWINKNIIALLRERNRLFQRYCNENNPTLKVAKHSKYKNVKSIFSSE